MAVRLRLAAIARALASRELRKNRKKVTVPKKFSPLPIEIFI